MAVSRAGGKLEAALARFDLAAAVRGARAVDVGASTGGFTEALLAHGAASVLAVDVGHGQLHGSLRADARVTSLEGVDWRKLSLNEAEGPFDFFTVDVSFVAARNMLRGLAFRLRPGAHGVVLVKPQFELADRQVKAGDVSDPNLRRAALDKVRRRAEALGFALRGEADSPVPGGEGTVEILTHFVFSERPASLPALGERRRETKRPPRGHKAPANDSLRWFAVVAPGLEEAAAREISALPNVSALERETGGVEWSAPALEGYRANLWLRLATRVLARVGTVEAREFGKLRHRAAALDWGAFVAPGASITLRASTSRCRLYHTGAITENAALAIVDAVKGARVAAKEEAADVSILVRGVEDRFTFSVDASGERLHRRGARVEVGAAPMRETLAAGLLALAGWDPTLPLVDPMCGAGTIVIEAAQQATGRAPGLDRALGEGFAIDDWPLFGTSDRAGAAAVLRDEARARVQAAAPAPLVGSDHDARAIESARRNAARAGVEAQIAFASRDVADARPPTATPGLVIANPPYGRRLANPRAAVATYRELGRVLRAHFRGWRAAIVVPQQLKDAAGALRLDLPEQHRLRNGGLPISLQVGTIR
ncbi:MAG TPA: SAM-dependent methyltransferase [Polyangia bacterium]|nr:SAM-dependent methyltransferase [Polyangia bacterium]